MKNTTEMSQFPDKIAVNGKIFEIIKLLGKGKGGYSYLVTDGEKRYVVKQIHHESCNYYRFGDKMQSEIRDYNRLFAKGSVCRVLLKWIWLTNGC